MTVALFTPARRRSSAAATLSPAVARTLFVCLLAGAATAGVLLTDATAARMAAAQAGPDLTRLLRFMALVKAALAAAALGATVWRLRWPVGTGRFVAYMLAGGATAAGPGLIWTMAHVGLGALLLHAGLAATLVLLWRDPALLAAIEAALARRGARR